MRIDSDPDLPDVDVYWTDLQCQAEDGNTTVATDFTVTLKSLDSDSTVTATTPCSSHDLLFPDLKRERYHATVRRGQVGTPLPAETNREIDLREGIDRTLHVDYFELSKVNYHFAWRLPTADACDAWNQNVIVWNPEIQASDGGFGTCDFLEGDAYEPPGEHLIQLVVDNKNVDVIIADSAPITITTDDEHIIDAGVFDLALCGSDCPQLAR